MLNELITKNKLKFTIQPECSYLGGTHFHFLA